jgi:hypothetical protein
MKTLWEKAKQRHGSTTETAEGTVASNLDKFKEFPGGHHSDTFVQHGYWSEIGDFLRSLNLA